MRIIINQKSTLLVAAFFLLLVAFTSCEQEKYGPNLSVAPGGGTVSVYKSYTLSSADAQDIYGRIVFWKDNTGVTLVQMGLYNTEASTLYAAGIYSGATVGSTTQLIPLYSVDGSTGSFSSSKFYIINDKTFFDKLGDYDASVKILKGTTPVAAGDIGMNATPVAEAG